MFTRFYSVLFIYRVPDGFLFCVVRRPARRGKLPCSPPSGADSGTYSSVSADGHQAHGRTLRGVFPQRGAAAVHVDLPVGFVPALGDSPPGCRAVLAPSVGARLLAGRTVEGGSRRDRFYYGIGIGLLTILAGLLGGCVIGCRRGSRPAEAPAPPARTLSADLVTVRADRDRLYDWIS